MLLHRCFIQEKLKYGHCANKTQLCELQYLMLIFMQRCGVERYTVCVHVCMLIRLGFRQYQVQPILGPHLFLAGVETLFNSSAARLGYKRQSGVSIIYSASTRKTPWALSRLVGWFSLCRVFQHFFVLCAITFSLLKFGQYLADAATIEYTK